MISLKSVDVTLNERGVLKAITLDLEQKRIGIIGQNGSGKSTFARLLNGLQLPNSGEVNVDGFNTKSEGRKVRARVGFVFQNPDNQIVYPTVCEDLAFGLKNIGYSKPEIADKISDALMEYGIEHLSDRLTHHLSGGEKQMVALVGVLIMRPNYVILDEPTTLLDLRNKRVLMDHVNDLSQRVVMVTHDLELLINFDRVICIHNGQVYADGSPDTVVSKYKQLCKP